MGRAAQFGARLADFEADALECPVRTGTVGQAMVCKKLQDLAVDLAMHDGLQVAGERSNLDFGVWT
ncbi:MAG: hypothetical protein ACREFI_17025, partial [Stellaceae bacterium]